MSPSTACALVMLWARAYTLGLPGDQRRARLGELASDLWESMHDPERPSTTADIVDRWAGGVVDDVRWRAAHATMKDVMALALATTAVAAAVWTFATMLAPQVLPEPHGRPMRFASERPAAPPAPPAPPVQPR